LVKSEGLELYVNNRDDIEKFIREIVDERFKDFNIFDTSVNV